MLKTPYNPLCFCHHRSPPVLNVHICHRSDGRKDAHHSAHNLRYIGDYRGIDPVVIQSLSVIPLRDGVILRAEVYLLSHKGGLEAQGDLPTQENLPL